MESNILNLNNTKHVHFIGIGGISMSGLAEILLDMGYKISGSDINSSNLTAKLSEKGVKVYIGHSEENIKNPDLVVYTAAVKESNPELKKSKSLKIPVMERSALLGEIMKIFPYSINVSGTHGKTTTTSMVSMILLECGLNPTIHVGGELDAIGGNTKIGENKYFVSEACEYAEGFLKYNPFLAVVLNIEEDHLDFFKDIEHIKSSFLKFISLVPREGYVIANYDDENIVSILEKANCNKITYGITSKEAMWKAKDIAYNHSGCASFWIYKNDEKIINITLKVPGVHNVSNALAAISACHALGCDIEDIKAGLESYTGTHRRFELKGMINDIKVVDDYAHHPSEVKATLKACKNSSYRKIWCVFQPHTYTRTKHLLNEFKDAFYDADTIIVSDIYAAREKDTGEVHSSMLVDKIKASNKNVLYMPDFESIVQHLNEHASPGDLVITMGAGNINSVGEMFLKTKKIVAVS
ncbi:UDP-N-acetylmuramate--L-alanine ligase [Herbivorax alkaliphila]